MFMTIKVLLKRNKIKETFTGARNMKEPCWITLRFQTGYPTCTHSAIKHFYLAISSHCVLIHSNRMILHSDHINQVSLEATAEEQEERTREGGGQENSIHAVIEMAACSFLRQFKNPFKFSSSCNKYHEVLPIKCFKSVRGKQQPIGPQRKYAATQQHRNDYSAVGMSSPLVSLWCCLQNLFSYRK